MLFSLPVRRQPERVVLIVSGRHVDSVTKNAPNGRAGFRRLDF